MTTPNHPPTDHPPQETEIAAGQILRARIKKVHLDSCELELLDDNDKVIAQGRLYQAGSQVWKAPRLLRDIPEYSQGKFLDAVYVRRLRHEEGRALWYVQERWGQNNPWEDLSLQEGNIVTGTVAHSVVSTMSGEQAGYLVQLEVGAPIRVSESGIIGHSERPQPDIEVFLPSGELPWADGSLGEIPLNDRIGRMPLTIGDPIQALVREIRMPPNNPVVSVARLINHQDTIAEKTFRHRENLAGWRFWRLLGKNKPEGVSEEEAPEFASGDKPYMGKRFLLVDDNPATLEAQSELLSLMGAEVRTIEVSTGRFGEAVSDVLKSLDDSNFDLALVDNNLPGKNLGQRLIHLVYAQLKNKYPVRFVLITADNMRIPEGNTRRELRDNGVKGFVQRPLKHNVLQQLLADNEVWEEVEPRTETGQSSGYSLAAKASLSARKMLEMVARQAGIHFAMLIRASREIEAQDLLAAGHAPFTWDAFPEVVARTDLHLLIEQRIKQEQLDILTQEGGNEFLCHGRDGRSHWRILDFSGARWIFGIGYAPDRDIQTQFPLWSAALGAAVDAQGWRTWGRHVSSFVQLGLAHQGLSHEVIHLQSEFSDLLFALRNRIGKLDPGAELKKTEQEYLAGQVAALTRSNDDLLAFSKHQLYAQALRHREVFLPDAVAAIRRIANYESYEAEVALHISAPPPLALPLPNAALVLPVINLLLNATKHHYRQENRRVELLFDLEERNNELFLLIDIRDNGPGLTRATLERLWQPGFSSAANVQERHGIGLWLSRQLVEEAGGTLELHEHWRGIGSCFRLRFPIHLG